MYCSGEVASLPALIFQSVYEQLTLNSPICKFPRCYQSFIHKKKKFKLFLKVQVSRQR